jgi:hypothetical protein
MPQLRVSDLIEPDSENLSSDAHPSTIEIETPTHIPKSRKRKRRCKADTQKAAIHYPAAADLVLPETHMVVAEKVVQPKVSANQRQKKPPMPSAAHAARVRGYQSLLNAINPVILDLYTMDHITELLKQRDGPWRVCAKYNKNPLDSDSICQATLLNIQGAPLQEASHPSEIAAGQSATPRTARMCIMCEAFEVCSQIAAGTVMRAMDGSPLCLHTWKVQVSESGTDSTKFSKDQVHMPETKGHRTTGVAAPFPTWATMLKLYKAANPEAVPSKHVR